MKYLALLNLILLVGSMAGMAAPADPTLILPSSNTVNVGYAPPLKVRVSEPGSGNLTVRYYGRLGYESPAAFAALHGPFPASVGLRPPSAGNGQTENENINSNQCLD